MASCLKCQHFRRETECPVEFPDLYWFACRKRPQVANLKSFPFTNTNCPQFTEKHEAH